MVQSSRPVTVGLLQMAMEPVSFYNLRRATRLVHEAARDKFDLVILPELFCSRYFGQTQDHAAFDLAEDLQGPTITAMQALARETNLVLVVPFFERASTVGVYYNSAVVIERDGRILGQYRKMHIPQDPRFEEKFYFTPGPSEQGFPVFDTSVGRLGVLICWDQWFPEAARLLALAGAEIVCVPTAIGVGSQDASFKQQQLEAWLNVQRGHAIANNFFWAAANRIGFEPRSGPEDGIDFWGHSVLYGPLGQTKMCATSPEEFVVGATCDLAEVEQARRHWPFLRDRRIDAYAGIGSRTLMEKSR